MTHLVARQATDTSYRMSSHEVSRCLWRRECTPTCVVAQPPIIRAEAAADFDLEAHYLSHGFEVISIERGDIPCMSFSILNNCVGHVKVVCAIKSWALTPYQLYNSLTRKKGLTMKLKQLFTVPGFGGSSPSPPPPPPPLPPPPTKADPAVIQSREAEKRRLKQARGLRSTIKTNKAPMAAATTADKTLLGN